MFKCLARAPVGARSETSLGLGCEIDSADLGRCLCLKETHDPFITQSALSSNSQLFEDK